MKKYKFIFWFTICILIYNSCISEYTFPSKDANEGVLVVESHIIGNSTNYVYLSRTTNINSENSFIPESGAEIFLQSNGERISEIATEYEAGKYRVEIGTLYSDIPYSLFISTSGDIYQSEEIYPVSTPEIDEITWDKKGKGEPVHIYVSTHDEKNQSSYYKWTFEEDWEYTANYYLFWFVEESTLTYYEAFGDSLYYCWDKDTSHEILIHSTKDMIENRVSDFKIHSIPCDELKLSELYSMLVKQTCISEEGYKYYENKKIFNEDMGSIFSPQPSELKGNISCINDPEKGVVGFINLTLNSTQKRIFIQGNLVYEYPNSRFCHEVYPYPPPYGYGGVTPRMFQEMGYYPFITKEIVIHEDIDFYVSKRCVDCELFSTGTKKKPDFWPTDHK